MINFGKSIKNLQSNRRNSHESFICCDDLQLIGYMSRVASRKARPTLMRDSRRRSPLPAGKNNLYEANVGGRRFKIVFTAVALVILIFALWIPVLSFGYIYDDHLQIALNPYIQSFSHVPDLLTQPLWVQIDPGKTSSYFRPLFSICLLGQYLLFGHNPSHWHLTSLVLHSSVALALFGFLLLNFNRIFPAFVGAAVFGTSPGTAEVVSWISASDESLYVLLILIALCCIAMRSRISSSRQRKVLNVSTIILLALALFAKETAIVGIPIAFGYEYFLLGRKPKLFAAYLFLLVPLCAFAFTHSRTRILDARSASSILASLPFVTSFALKKLIWPSPVAAFYDLWFDQRHSLPSIVTACACVAFIVFVMIICWFKWPYSFGTWASLVIFLPILLWMSSIRLLADYSLVHDRYLYLSIAGIGMLAAFCVSLAERRWMIFLSAGLLLIVSAQTIQARKAVWQYRDDYSFSSNAVLVAPNNVLAIQYLGEAELKLKDCNAATKTYKHAEELRPDLWVSQFYLGITYMHCGLVNLASDAFGRAATATGARSEEYALALYELARARLRLGDYEAARIALGEAAIRDPKSKKIQSLFDQTRTGR